ncbi:MAG TPA: DUF2149 domain-containing protein [Pirellulales bacterium]
MRRKRKWDRDDDDPAAGLLNLVDVWLVFAVALSMALVTYYHLPELAATQADVTMVENAGQPDMKIIHKRGREIESLKMTGNMLGGEGEKLGTAYRLPSGKVVYVPER